MAQKAIETAVPELHKLINELVNKVASLEASITNQNEIINKQAHAIDQLRIQVEGKQPTSSSSATPVAQSAASAQRPVRQARLTAAANIASGSSATTAAKKRNTGTEKVRLSIINTSPKCEKDSEHPKKTIPVTADSSAAGKATTLTAEPAILTSMDKVDGIIVDEWQTVSRKRPPTKQRKILTGSGERDDDLQTAERIKYIQAWSFRPETTVENLRNYINKIAKCDTYLVEKRDIKTDKHAAFVIGFPEKLYDQLYSPCSWPPGVKLSDWFRKHPRGERGTPVTVDLSVSAAAHCRTTTRE